MEVGILRRAKALPLTARFVWQVTVRLRESLPCSETDKLTFSVTYTKRLLPTTWVITHSRTTIYCSPHSFIVLCCCQLRLTRTPQLAPECRGT